MEIGAPTGVTIERAATMRSFLPLVRPLLAPRLASRPFRWVDPGPGSVTRSAPFAAFSSRTHRALPLYRNESEAAATLAALRPRLPRRAQELLDLGALVGVRAGSDGRVRAPVLRTLVAHEPPGIARHETVTAFNVLLRHLHVAQRCCPKCLYPRARCVCARVGQVRPPRRARIWVFQHVGEFGRPNNSGSLLCLVAGARRATRGIVEEQDEMLADARAAQRDGSAVVLFPTADATDVTQFVAERRERLGLRAARESPLCVIVLDGTGRQARNLERFLPDDIPRVKLSIDEEFGSDSWLNPVRMQTEAHRVCSAQAAANVLEIVGEQTVAHAVEDAVRIVVDDLARERAGVKGGGAPLFV